MRSTLFGPDPAHLARRDHPATSKMAAESIAPRLGELQAYALAKVRQTPDLTAVETGQRPFSDDEMTRFGNALRPTHGGRVVT